MMRTASFLILFASAVVSTYGQATEPQLDLQVNYSTHDFQSADGDTAKFQPIDRPGQQIANVTGFSWKVTGTLTGNPAALVRVKWYRGDVELMNGVLVLPDQLGTEASFSVAPTAGLYRVELWLSLKPGQDERKASVEFEVKAPPLDATEPFEDLRDVARQKEQVWRWKVQEVTFYTVARYLPSCNLGRIQLAMQDPEQLMGQAANQWREYYSSRVEKLNDEQNKGADLPAANAELQVLQKELDDLNRDIQKAKDSRDVLSRNGLPTTKSDEYLNAIEKEDLPAKQKAIAAKQQQIADIIAEQTQEALDLANAQRDLNHVDSDAAFEKDQLTQQFGEYERQCRSSAQAVPVQKVN